MPAAKAVVDIRHGEMNRLDASRCERFRMFKAVPEFTAKWFSAHELLITAHLRICRPGLRVWEVIRININQLDNEIRIRSRRGDVKSRRDRSREPSVFFEGLCQIRQNISAARSETLVRHHIGA